MPLHPGYKRYALTKNGNSARAVPGWGDGPVSRTATNTTKRVIFPEDFGVRTAMVDKRLKKLDALTREALAPRLMGPRAMYDLLVGWGSTFDALAEALQRSGRTDAALLHFSQVYPVCPKPPRS